MKITKNMYIYEHLIVMIHSNDVRKEKTYESVDIYGNAPTMDLTSKFHQPRFPSMERIKEVV